VNYAILLQSYVTLASTHCLASSLDNSLKTMEVNYRKRKLPGRQECQPIETISENGIGKTGGTKRIHMNNTYETSIGFFTIPCDLFEKSATEFKQSGEG